MDHPGNPMYEGTGTAARGVAELMAVMVMIAQYIRQSQEVIKASQLNRQLHEAALTDKRRHLDASQWSLALDRGWMRTATTDEVIHIWTRALPWRGEEVRAARAQRLAEARLEQLDPELMRRYRRLIEDGADELSAMWQARQLPGEPPAAKARKPIEPVTVAGELTPPSEAWQANPAPVSGLPRAEPLELGPGSAWEMGPVCSTESGGGPARPGEPSTTATAGSTRQRLAAAAASPDTTQGRTFMSSPADFDRGELSRPCGSPIVQPISRPIVAGPGAGFSAVRVRGRAARK
jgi:hypothetical protein